MKKLLLLLPLLLVCVRPAEAQKIRCVVTNSTATTIQAVGGNCIAPTGDQQIFITDIVASSTVASTATADAGLTLKSGTGGTCGTATTVVWQAQHAATSTVVVNFNTPLKLTKNHELCWINTVAGTKSWVITGYIGHED
jgi:hypothetical protein